MRACRSVSVDNNNSPPSRKRDYSQAGGEDMRPKKKSRSPVAAPLDDDASSTSGSAASSARPSNEALDIALRNNKIYRTAHQHGETLKAVVLTLVVNGAPWLNQEYSSVSAAWQLLTSNTDLNDLITQCMKTEEYASVREHVALQVRRTWVQRLEDMKHVYMPQLKKFARSDFLTALEPAIDAERSAAVETAHKMIDEETCPPVVVNECFDASDDHILFNGAGSSKTDLLVKGMLRRLSLYFPVRQGGSRGLGSASLLNALHYIRTSGPNPFVHRLDQSGYSEGDRYLILAAVAHLTVLDWLLECLDDLSLDEMLRIWTYLQLCPWLGGVCAGDDIFVSVFEQIKGVERERGVDNSPTIHLHISALKRRWERRFGFQRLFLVFDNAELLDRELNPQVVVSSTGNDGDDRVPRSASYAVMQVWSRHECLLFPECCRVISTTSLPLDLVKYGRHLSFAKPSRRGWFVQPTARSFDNKVELQSYVMQNIWPALSASDLSGHHQTLVSRMWRWLRGRTYYAMVYVEMLKKHGTSCANRILDRLVERLSGGYVPTDGITLASREPPLGADAEASLEAISSLPCCHLPDDESLEPHLRRALTNFLVFGNSYELPHTYHHAVTTGFARVLDKSREFIVTDHICDPVRLEGLLLGINEPLVFASLFQAYRERGLTLPKVEFLVDKCQLELERSFAQDVSSLLLTSIVDGTRSLKELSTLPRNMRRKGICCTPLTLVSITGRNEDGRFTTEDYRPEQGSVPCLAYRAKGCDDVQRWCNGTGIPFLFPGEEPISDIVFLARAGQELLWIFFRLDYQFARSSVSRTNGNKASQDVAHDLLTVRKASGTENDMIPIVQLLASTTRGSHVDARTKKSPVGHVTATFNGLCDDDWQARILDMMDSVFISRILEGKVDT